MILREHLERVRARRPAKVELLASDTLLQDALAMSLLVAIQEAIDIAFHVVTDEGWGMPGSYAEAFDILAKHHVIQGALVSSLEGCARLRNRLAHGYASVDVERIWSELPSGIQALDDFVAAISVLVQKA